MKKHIRKFLTISVLLTATSTAICAVNKFINATATLKDLLHSKSKNFYNWKFGRIHYTVQGSGSPLLLIHDLMPYCSLVEWKSVAESLAKNHTVYCIDLLGCGCSDRPKITYTNFLYVQLITDFIKHVIKEKTDVAASGLSGSFTIMACKNDDSIINRIMLINPVDLAVLNQIPSKKSKAAKFLLELPVIGSLLYNVIMSRANIDLLFTENFLYNPFHQDPTLGDAYYESAHLSNGNGRYLLGSIKGKYIYCNIAHALKSINNSIYIIEGKSEPRAEESIALYQSMNSSIESEFFPHARHIPHVECSKKILESMNIFFD